MIKTLEKFHLKITWSLLILVICGQFFFAVSITNAGELTSGLLLDCVNEIRQSHGVTSPLAFNEQLHSAASLKLQDMKQFGYWRHENPVSGEKPWDFVEKAGYDYSYTGENLALGYLNSEDVCSAWAASPEHLKNILSDNFNEAGVAIDRANLNDAGKGILVVMMFGGRDTLAGTNDCGNHLSANTTNENQAGETSSELKNIILFVIVFSYALTFIVLLFNYVAKKKRKQSKIMAGVLSVFAFCSVILTLLLFIMKF